MSSSKTMPTNQPSTIYPTHTTPANAASNPYIITSSGSLGNVIIPSHGGFPTITKAEPFATKVKFVQSQSNNPKLPPIEIVSNDEHDVPITLRLEPESGIDPASTLKLVMMLTALSFGGASFSAYAFIKENNLERHFKFIR